MNCNSVIFKSSIEIRSPSTINYSFQKQVIVLAEAEIIIIVIICTR